MQKEALLKERTKIFTFKRLELEDSEILPVNLCSSCRNNLSFTELCQSPLIFSIPWYECAWKHLTSESRDAPWSFTENELAGLSSEMIKFSSILDRCNIPASVLEELKACIPFSSCAWNPFVQFPQKLWVSLLQCAAFMSKFPESFCYKMQKERARHWSLVK